jgi:hypothetical protein
VLDSLVSSDSSHRRCGTWLKNGVWKVSKSSLLRQPSSAAYLALCHYLQEVNHIRAAINTDFSWFHIFSFFYGHIKALLYSVIQTSLTPCNGRSPALGANFLVCSSHKNTDAKDYTNKDLTALQRALRSVFRFSSTSGFPS